MSTEMSTNRLRQNICKDCEITYFYLHSYICIEKDKNALLNDNTGG